MLNIANNPIMLSVVMLNVVMLSVVAPFLSFPTKIEVSYRVLSFPISARANLIKPFGINKLERSIL
jgi:hypothetical protein